MKPFAVINQTEILYENWTIPSNCQSIAFKNIGDIDCEISGFPLKAGDAMITFQNNDNYAVDITRYDLQFTPAAKQTGNKKLLVVRTFHDFTKQPKQNIK